MISELNSLMSGFKITRLEDLKQLAVNERIDIKYFFSMKLLPRLISELIDKYCILKVEDTCIQVYKTVYYDTSALKLYLDHHNGKLNRYKIRKRHYITNDIAFSEIKFKSNKGTTFKSRINSDKNLEKLTEFDKRFFAENTNLVVDNYFPQATVYFNRVTLIGNPEKERITMDFNLKLERFGKEANLGNIVIAEVKKHRTEPDSPMEIKLNELGIKSSSFSKYCIAVAMIDEQIKKNNFKIKIKEFKKINNES